MPPTRLSKMILYEELSEGKRLRGGPKRRFKDQLKWSLAQADIPVDNWERIANERNSWCRKVCKGVEAFEDERRLQQEQKRQDRKRS